MNEMRTTPVRFPDHGQIEFNRFWSGVARSSFPAGDTPDLDKLGAKFLQHLETEHVPLDHESIEQTFRSFCTKLALYR